MFLESRTHTGYYKINMHVKTVVEITNDKRARSANLTNYM